MVCHGRVCGALRREAEQSALSVDEPEAYAEAKTFGVRVGPESRAGILFLDPRQVQIRSELPAQLVTELVQQEYAIRNPHGFKAYCDCCWGFTACHGPGPATHVIDGVERRFLGYAARGAPFGPDDGTIAPWTVVASLPFAPDVVLPTVYRFQNAHVRVDSRYGFDSTFNPTYPGATGASAGWFCPWSFAIDRGAIALMTENYWTGLIWRLIRRCPYVRTGLHRAGFTGGWLSAPAGSD